jgi:integration host factor subunit beta
MLDNPQEWEYATTPTQEFGRRAMDAFFRRSKCMTKAELVEKVADKIQLTKKQTEAVVNILLNCITEALSEGDKVELRGFGSFRIRNRNPREGRNPKTGDTVQIPAKRVPFFKAGKELREMVDSQ